MILNNRNYAPFVTGRRGKQVEYLEVNFRLAPEEVADWPMRVKPQGILKFKYNELESWREWEEIEPRTYRNPVQCLTPEVLAYRYPVPAYFKRDIQTSGVIPYQDGILRYVMRPANYSGGRILEIGTRLGHSASIIAQTAPSAEITTIEPYAERVVIAKENLAPYPNVTVITGKSWEYLKAYQGPEFDAVFVDGNHRYVNYDAPWYYLLKPDGVILFHDWSSWGCWHVVETVENMSRELERRPDIEIMDTNQKGMAGFYRHV